MTIKVLHSEEEINGGSINFTVSWSLDGKQPSIVLIHEKLYFCDFISDLKVNCPIKVGHHSVPYSNHVSPILPDVSVCCDQCLILNLMLI